MGFGDTTVYRMRKPDVVPGYRLVQLVGQGGMGEVHQAEQLSLKRTVALKLLNPELAKDSQFVARFEKEAAALAALRHPNIVSIVDRGKSAETYYLVMEFVDGPSLRERMRDPDFDVPTTLRVLMQVARALEYAHGRGVIHRDIKPENILFDMQAGRIPKVSDFGLAGFEEGGPGPGRGVSNLTQTHVAMGTAAYMAPEQRVDARTAGPRADLYSFGVMLYECLTGELPLGNYDPPSQRNPAVDKRLDAIVARCLKTSPDDRYPSASELLQDLEVLVTWTLPGAAAHETPIQRTLRQARSVALKVYRGVALALVAAATLIVIAALGRFSSESKRISSGAALTAEYSLTHPLHTPGRLDRASRTLTLGSGPDTVGVLASGRRPLLVDGDVVYGPPEDVRSGRAVIDAQVPGEGLVFSSRVDTQAIAPSVLEPLWAIFRGPRGEARAGLLLVGDHGRYVSLVVSGRGDSPELEWALGPDKRGLMRAPLPTAATGQSLQLRIEPGSGELLAIIGTGRDARILGDPLHLGADWRALFGDAPRPAVGCLEGICAFRQLRFEGLALPVPPPPPPPTLPEEPKSSKPAMTSSGPATKTSSKSPPGFRPAKRSNTPPPRRK